jgi:hypothetical protein
MIGSLGAAISANPAAAAAFLSAAVALLAAIFAVKNTTRTLRASVVSANRQRWIDALRDDLATFLRCKSIATRHDLSSMPSAKIIGDAQEARLEMYMLSSASGCGSIRQSRSTLGSTRS